MTKRCGALGVLLCLILLSSSQALSKRRTPIMGWSSWSVYSCNVHEDGIKVQAQALSDLGLWDLGYTYIDVDDCWMAFNRSAEGLQQANASTFPSGMAALAEWLHARGFKLGLYSDAGTTTCQNRAGSYGYEAVDAATYASWGVDLLKYDTCNTVPGWDPEEGYPIMGKALNNTGRDIWYMMCNWGQGDPATWAGPRALANSWRTTNDLMPLFPQFYEVADANERWWQHARPGQFNDPDTLAMGYLFADPPVTAPATGNTLSYAETRLYFGLWCIMKSNLILSVDFASSEWPRWILDIVSNRHAIAINQDALALQGHRLWSDGEGGNNTDPRAVHVPAGLREVWSGPLVDGDVALLLVNRGESIATINATFTLHGPHCPKDVNVSVYDVWGQRVFGECASHFAMRVAPHDGILLRCSCARPATRPARKGKDRGDHAFVTQ